ncbi:hypothetical protein TNCV_4296611 [Trichonephila clavipes]|nr:hypothetical protein TNCV_4296611 [Trichonephila clavipes]
MTRSHLADMTVTLHGIPMFWKIPSGVERNAVGRLRLRTVSRSSKKNSYSKEELGDMLIVYGAADCYGHTTRRLY